MTGQTPIYGLPYLTGSDGGRHVPQVSRDLALQLEAILARTGQTPLDSDLQSLLQRLAAVEDKVQAAPFQSGEHTITNQGTVGTSQGISWSGPQTVTFDRPYISPPKVFATTEQIEFIGWVMTGPATETGFTYRYQRLGTSTSFVGLKMQWVAIGELA